MNLKKITAIFLAFGIATFSVFPADISIVETPTAPSVNDSPAVAFVRKLNAVLQTGSIDQALLLFSGMPPSLQNDMDLKKLHASLMISAELYGDAKSLVSELESKLPNDVEVKEMKMILAKAEGNSSAKTAALKEIIALDPNNSYANTELAQEQVLKHKYKPAKNYYLKALKGDSKNLDALFGYGQTSYYLNEISAARTAFKKMLEIDPQNAVAYSYIGKIYAEDENYKMAEENVLKAIALDDSNYDFYMDLGTYQRFRGKFKDAEKAWTNAIKINPEYFLAYAYRAGLYDEQNLYDEALEDYRMVVKTNPQYYFAYESLGMLAWRIGNFDEARAAFEKAYSYNKTNVSYPLMIAACYYKANKPHLVKPFLAKALKDFPDRNSLEYLMLRLYHDFGPTNAENQIVQKIQQEENKTKKGKMTFYLALYDEMKGRNESSNKIYSEVASLQSPMFFEFRLAEWKVK